MKFRSLIGNERGAWGLIGLLIALAIGALIVALFLGPQLKSSMGGANTTPGKAIEKAHDVECQSNVMQIRSAITMYRTEHQAPPPSLADVRLNVSNPNFTKCPVGHEDYVYDPATGTIHCPHPGHENY